MGDTITKNSALNGFNSIVNWTGMQMVKSGNWTNIPFTQNEFDALVHFNYNTGPYYGTRTPGKKALYDLISAQKYEEAGKKILTTITLNGLLTSRRNKESTLFLENQPPNPV